ncbi:hypothetical protein L5515_008800 [Caenorhabditis briggsae]|uniref:Uncharacterized protein n=1 Tax=Caenorhabditis briggsae TaxID=6238 RepID=A0AAE9F1Z0_CAEBR|nr:hypothetical protein L5515_008800 [Caenorhabditis briggsae]
MAPPPLSPPIEGRLIGEWALHSEGTGDEKLQSCTPQTLRQYVSQSVLLTSISYFERNAFPFVDYQSAGASVRTPSRLRISTFPKNLAPVHQDAPNSSLNVSSESLHEAVAVCSSPYQEEQLIKNGFD